MRSASSKRSLSRGAALVVAAIIALITQSASAVPSLVSFNSQPFPGPSSAEAFNFSVAPNDNRLLLVGFQHEQSSGGARQITSLTYGGEPLTFLNRQTTGSNQEAAEFWYLIDPPVGSASLAVALNASTESGRGFRLTAFDIAGAAQVAPIGTGSNDQTNNISTAINTVGPNSLLIGMTHNQGGGGSHAPGMGVTELLDIDAVSITAAIGTKVSASAGANVFEWTQSGGGGLDVQAVAAIAAAPPMMLGLDFNDRGTPGASSTQPGFQEFLLSGADGTTVNTPVVRTFDGVTVTLTHTNGGTVDDRIRANPTNSGLFTTEQLLRDFVFAAGTNAADGLNLRFDGLAGDTEYLVTVYSFDDGSPNARTSDWFANGILVKNDYSFNGNAVPPSPANDGVFAFSFKATTTNLGALDIRGLAVSGANPNVFLNAISIEQIKPIPEPATVGLMLLSIAGLLRRRKRA